MVKRIVMADDTTGELPPVVENHLNSAIAGAGELKQAVVVVGHSMVEATSTNWTEVVLAPLLGVPVGKCSRAGWASTDLSILWGSTTPAITLSGDQVPASGAVAITGRVPSSAYRTNGTGAIEWTGVLACLQSDGTVVNVPGKMRHDQLPADTWTFTRTTNGSIVQALPGSIFSVSDGEAFRDRILVVWAGRNNLDLDAMDVAIRDTDLIIGHQKSAAKRALVLSDLNSTTEIAAAGSQGAVVAYQKMMRYNRLTSTRHDYLDVRRFLIDWGLAMAGITPTDTDRGNIANDTVPVSLRDVGDTLHPNLAGYTIVAKLIAQYFAVHGWINGLIPVEAPGQVVGLTAGTSTDTTQLLSWTAEPAAVGYKVELRVKNPQSGATWVASALTTSVTITNLTPGVEYEYRTTPVNAAGPGVPSAWVSATTTGTTAAIVGSDSFDGPDTLNISGRTLDNALGGSGTRTWAALPSNQLGIRDGKIYRSGLTNTLYARTDFGITDGRCEWPLTTLASGTVAVALVGRYTDSNNHYRLEVSGAGNLSLRKMVGGQSNALAPTVGGVKDGDSVALRCVGSTISAIVNGVTVISVTNTDITTGTVWGLMVPNDARMSSTSVIVRNG